MEGHTDICKAIYHQFLKEENK